MSEGKPRRGHRAGTRQQELLLKAALLEGAASLAAWRQWNTEVDLDDLDQDSQRLLPLLYRALRREGISHPAMGRLKGTYRRSWYDNTLRFHAGAAILRALHDAGISTMLLKGAALVPRYYRDAALRPMDDFDILVPTPQAAPAMEALKRLGWTPLPEQVGITEAEALASGHAYPFRNGRNLEVDLHWHVFYQHVEPAADTEFWAAASPIVISSVSTRSLSAADQLLHVCVHGIERAWWGGEQAPNLRWIADAAMILNTARDELDWNRVLAQAQRLRFVLPMREALGCLTDLLGVTLPASAQKIYLGPVPAAERIAELARARPSRRWGPWVALGVVYLEYSSTFSADAGLFRRIAGLPAFLRRRWGLRSFWHLPFEAVSRTIRRIRWTRDRGRNRRGDVSTQGTRP